MKIHIYQLAVSVISAIMIYKGFENYIKGRNGQTILKLAVRVMVWGGMTIIALFPTFTNVLASTIGMEGNINAIILTGFILVFLMIFKLLSAIERLEQALSEVTRKDAIKDISKEN